MLTYDDMVIWTKDYDLLNNRKKIINQLLGSRYPESNDGFCRVFYKRGRYTVECGGSPLCDFGVYDVPGLSDALRTLDAWSDCVWHLSRSGRIAA